MGSSIDIRLAETEAEITAAQNLRFKVFVENMGAQTSDAAREMQRDFDQFDEYCDHLIAIDKNSDPKNPRVVGTYRFLRGKIAEETCGFYSANEYDLSPLKNFEGEIMELGRSCVDPDFRDRAVMQHMWRGISEYVLENNVGLMFGCASFPGTDPDTISEALSYLHYYRKAPNDWCPRALAERYIKMNRLPKDDVDTKKALREMPPLVKGYLRLGAVIGDGAVIDHDFNTVDVCLMVETVHVTDRYMRHYLKDHGGQVPSTSG